MEEGLLQPQGVGVQPLQLGELKVQQGVCLSHEDRLGAEPMDLEEQQGVLLHIEEEYVSPILMVKQTVKRIYQDCQMILAKDWPNG